MKEKSLSDKEETIFRRTKGSRIPRSMKEVRTAKNVMKLKSDRRN
jgi:hypothetical protein